MRLVIRDLAGRSFELGVQDGCWVDPAEGPVEDLTHLWAVPGLADAHAHLAQDHMTLEPGDPAAIGERAMAVLDSGVFLCFDKGWRDESVLGLLDRPPGRRPDLQAAGRMIAGRGGYFENFATETDEAGLVEAIASASTRGGWIKLVGDWPRRGRGAVANFAEEALVTAVDVAHRAGTRVAIHTMAPDVPSWAVRAGVDSIEHGLYLTEDDLAALGGRGGAWVPTVLRMEAVIEEIGADRTGGRVVAEGLRRVRDRLSVAVEAGVFVLAGSDLAMPSGRVAAEAIRLIDYGLTPEQAVSAVSTDAFAYAGTPRGFGMGEPADLVAFDRHPFDDPSVLLSPERVVRAGRDRRGGDRHV